MEWTNWATYKYDISKIPFSDPPSLSLPPFFFLSLSIHHIHPFGENNWRRTNIINSQLVSRLAIRLIPHESHTETLCRNRMGPIKHLIPPRKRENSGTPLIPLARVMAPRHVSRNSRSRVSWLERVVLLRASSRAKTDRTFSPGEYNACS